MRTMWAHPITREIDCVVPLCDERGCLNPEAIGWSRRPWHVGNLRGRFPRKKKWSYWCITGDRFLFSATVANVDYAGLAGIYFLDYANKQFVEQGAFRPVSRNPAMPETVAGLARFGQGKLVVAIDDRGSHIDIMVRSRRFGGEPLNADLRITRPEGHESLNVVVPWTERMFQFTSKQHCLPTAGTLQWGGQTFNFDERSTFACLDYGRGIWPYHTAWNWGSFSGRSGNDVVGVNMGAKWTDGTGATENGILLNGRLHKIFEDIAFTYDATDFMKPWTMRTVGSNTIDLTLEPFYDNKHQADLLLLRTQVHQMFGHYSGALCVEGRTVPIDHVIGWAEEHIARW